MLGMKNHFDISDSIEIGEVDIAGVACTSFSSLYYMFLLCFNIKVKLVSTLLRLIIFPIASVI